MIGYVSVLLEQLTHTFSKDQVFMAFNPKTCYAKKQSTHSPPEQISNTLLYTSKCQDDCPVLYIKEIKQPLAKHMA